MSSDVVKASLTRREQRLVAALANGEPLDDAWRNAGYSLKTDRSVVLRRPDVAGALATALKSRVLELQGKALQKLSDLVTTADSDAVSRRAARDILELGGMREGQAPPGAIVINISTGDERETITINNRPLVEDRE